MSQYKLYERNHVFVIWRWTWKEQSDTSGSDSEKSSAGEDSHQRDAPAVNTSSSNPDSSDSDDDAIPPITHSVVFKCIGSLKELRYQEILPVVAKKIKQGETVPVRIQKEPDNPVDSRAIAFECRLNDRSSVGRECRD